MRPPLSDCSSRLRRALVGALALLAALSALAWLSYSAYLWRLRPFP